MNEILVNQISTQEKKLSRLDDDTYLIAVLMTISVKKYVVDHILLAFILLYIRKNINTLMF